MDPWQVASIILLGLFFAGSVYMIFHPVIEVDEFEESVDVDEYNHDHRFI